MLGDTFILLLTAQTAVVSTIFYLVYFCDMVVALVSNNTYSCTIQRHSLRHDFSVVFNHKN